MKFTLRPTCKNTSQNLLNNIVKRQVGNA